MNPEELESELLSFSGTENWYRHPFGIVYTDGVQFLAEQAQAYWLIDAIASHQHTAKVRREPFQVWTLQVGVDRAPTKAEQRLVDAGGAVFISRANRANPQQLEVIQLLKPTAAVLTGDDGDKGDGALVLARQNIPYTDFQLPFV